MKDPAGNTLGRGTAVKIFLKSDASEYAEEKTLRDLIKKHSEFINFPIRLKVTKEVSKEVEIEDEDGEAGKKEEKTDDEIKVEDEDEKKPEEKKKTKTVKEKV